MDVRYINPFVKSITNIFETMLSSNATFGKPYVQSGEGNNPDVSGVIGFSGDASGAVVLSVSKEKAVKIASQFAGMEIEVESADFADAIGELVNMVAGGAKAEFHGLSVNISLPSVIIGDGHAVSNLNAHPGLVIPCETPLGAFDVHVSMKVNKEAAVGAAS